MNDSTAMHGTTMHAGPLGSTVHVIRADAETVAHLAAIDWSRHFRRVCLDSVRGLITLMSPSYSHEDPALFLDQIVDIAGSVLSGGSKGLRSTRLRGPGEPSGTGMEPDCAFYVGERARGFFRSRRESRAAVEAYVERVAPDLVVEKTVHEVAERPFVVHRPVQADVARLLDASMPFVERDRSSRT